MDTTPVGGREPEWSPRQVQVLDLLAAGRTNWQIAEALGISLEGAKYHVREIVSKLGVEGREGAAEYWRRRSSVRTRAGRAMLTVVAGMRWRWIGFAAAGMLASALGIWLALPGRDRQAGADDAIQISAPEWLNLPLPQGTGLAWALPGFAGGPGQTQVALPLDARRAEDLAVLERIARWMAAAKPVGPADFVDAAFVGPFVEVGLEDGPRVRVLEGTDCETTVSGYRCTAVAGMVDVSVRVPNGEEERYQWAAPELQHWLRYEWTSDVRSGTPEERDRLLRDLTGP